MFEGETLGFRVQEVYQVDQLVLEQGQPVLSHVGFVRREFDMVNEFLDPFGRFSVGCERGAERRPMTFFVRYSHNERDRLRPGVNLHSNDYYVDLREMPGGKRCVVEVIATNGYRTSYARTRHFVVPQKPPELLMGANEGPVLFAQGFSREHGPITSEDIAWLADGEVCQTGGTLDVRTLSSGIQEISVRATAPDGRESIAVVGSYDTKSGVRAGPPDGL